MSLSRASTASMNDTSFEDSFSSSYGEEKKEESQSSSVRKSRSERIAKSIKMEEESRSPVRKSGRERKATTMTIQGHTVLTKNNYTVTQGEYIFDTYKADKKKKPKKKNDQEGR